MNYKYPVFVALVLVFSHACLAQNPIEIHLGKDNPYPLQISGNVQFWLRYTDLNPGSLVNGEPRANLLDLSVRRYRLKFSGKASEKLRYTLLLGNNNINYYTYKDPQVKVLEAFIDYQVSKNFAAGIGKQGWTGLSRYAAPAAGQALAYDIGFVSIPLVVVHDDILRRWGVYARGKIENLDYRASLSIPHYSPASDITPLPHRATFGSVKPAYQFSTYIKYHFLEHESQLSAWSPGTYLGEKKILNLGAGMLHQPNTTWHLSGNNIIYNDLTSFALDLFYEQALPAHRAVTFYMSYHIHDLGKNFIRNIGINNPAPAGIPTQYMNGPGNRAPIVGTGKILAAQAGYLRPLGKENQRQLQPFASLEYGMLDGLEDPNVTYNGGFNLYLNKQNSKISLGYDSRALFKQEGALFYKNGRKGMWVLQYQLQF